MSVMNKRWAKMIAAATMGVVCAGATGVAQAGSQTNDTAFSRLIQLEQQADLLSNHVLVLEQGFDGLGIERVSDRQPITVKVAQSRQVAEVNVRIDAIEERMRTLTGQVEGLQFQLTQMQTLLERMQEDYEFRFQELEGGALGKTSAAPQSDRETPSGGVPQSQSEGTLADQDVPLTLGTPEGTLGTLSDDALAGIGAGQPMDLEFDPGAALSDADAKAQYDAGYEALLRGDYVFAEDQFRQFIGLFPNNRLAPDAYHWLGDSLLNRGEYEEAAEVLLRGFEAHPNAARSPDMVMKLGISLNSAGERETACRTFVEVLRRYPDQPKAFKQRVSEEQRKAQC
ncbi:tol-pal system protein YbgF [Maritalea myrionectae]|uniref:tol-pal system protein YbgF n=1 Tax=Maritalea myrionectae TaxID=454601 RepID=UPI000429C6DB|nr:tol-pal system protein YbgF [Maritalea myrionectae]